MPDRDSEMYKMLVTSSIGDDRVRGLVANQLQLVIAPSSTVMDSILVSPPALAYNAETNLYYVRKRGVNYGTLQPVSTTNPRSGLPMGRDPDFWSPITAMEYLYVVNNKTELDALINDIKAPAIAYRRDNSRYYYLIGPAGYNGKTGLNQMRDEQGNQVFVGSDYITGLVNIPGENTWNSLYTSYNGSQYTVGGKFMVYGADDPDTHEPITFTVTSITNYPGQNKSKWGFTPEYDMLPLVGASMDYFGSTMGSVLPYASGTTPTTMVAVVALTGPVFPGNTFFVEGYPTEYTILDPIIGNVWNYTPPSIGPFPHRRLVTMGHAGIPVMEVRDPDIWICNSHLYEDNAQGFL